MIGVETSVKQRRARRWCEDKQGADGIEEPTALWTKQVWFGRAHFSKFCFKDWQARQELQGDISIWRIWMHDVMKEKYNHSVLIKKKKVHIDVGHEMTPGAPPRRWREKGWREEEGSRERGGFTGKAKQANNRARRKYCATGDRRAEEEDQQAWESLVIILLHKSQHSQRGKKGRKKVHPCPSLLRLLLLDQTSEPLVRQTWERNSRFYGKRIPLWFVNRILMFWACVWVWRGAGTKAKLREGEASSHRTFTKYVHMCVHMWGCIYLTHDFKSPTKRVSKSYRHLETQPWVEHSTQKPDECPSQSTGTRQMN